ncbi:GPP34 family phosphoprotein [Streptomyces sp. ISL-11]|uniref:GOLPH3/VPS74 family protein n=1 Tax=Streptomyces sp. ISL-11 TaxID=2819174 RepID=UPI001BEA98EC|nr:GPP34 family phosphoprotein [Streptomyces sp. ISL-11]MBT2384154.1 GPP34 family phosphoprotein [Streptomyces sp. ISL-11]
MTVDGSGLTLPEELLLLSFDPASGRKLCTLGALGYGVAGAVLAELRLMGRIAEHYGRPVVLDPRPPGDPLLAMATASLPAAGTRGPKTHRWVRTAARHVDELWLVRLVERRALRAEAHRFLGVFPHLRYPVGPQDRTTAARQRFEAARLAGFPDPRSRALAALVSATGVAGKLYPGWDWRHERKALRRLVRLDWAAQAVRLNVQRDQSGGGDGGGGSASDGGGDSGGGGDGGGGGGGD